MLKRTRQTSPGEPRVGTTYVDETSQGALPAARWPRSATQGRLPLVGEVADGRAHVRRLAQLFPAGVCRERDPAVRHHAKLNVYGVYRLAAPIFKRFAAGSALSRLMHSRHRWSRTRAQIRDEHRRPDGPPVPGSAVGEVSVSWSTVRRRRRGSRRRCRTGAGPTTGSRRTTAPGPGRRCRVGGT